MWFAFSLDPSYSFFLVNCVEVALGCFSHQGHACSTDWGAIALPYVGYSLGVRDGRMLLVTACLLPALHPL